MSTSYPLRIPEKLMKIVELREEEEYVSKATALRQLLYKGAEDFVLELYKEGRISLSRAASLLDKSTHDIIWLTRKKGIQVGATREQQKISEETTKEMTD